MLHSRRHVAQGVIYKRGMKIRSGVVLCVSLLGASCGKNPHEQGPEGSIEQVIAYGAADPAPLLDQLDQAYRSSTVARREALRGALFRLYYKWGAMEAAWRFKAEEDGVLSLAEYDLTLVLAAKHGWAFVGEGRAAARGMSLIKGIRDGSVTPNNIFDLEGLGGVGLFKSIALVYLSAGESEHAAKVSLAGLNMGRVLLEVAEWDGIDHGRDKGPHVTADCIILMRILGAAKGHLNLKGHEEAADIARRMYESFRLNPKRMPFEVAYLESHWTSIDEILLRVERTGDAGQGELGSASELSRKVKGSESD